MSKIALNLATNIVGRGWSSLLSLALVPLYIHYLGIESFGLIGFFATLQAASLLLDLGLSTTINREMARRSVTSDDLPGQRDLLRTLELVNWGIAAVLGGAIWLLAPMIAHHWINPGTLDPQAVTSAVQMMGLALALKWPANIYNGALMGLQRQVSMNVLLMLSSTVAGGGAVLILIWVAPTVEAFFTWQLVVNGLMTLATGGWAWRCLNGSGSASARFRMSILIDTWRFSAGVSGITVLGVLLTQMDKLVLSAVLSLEQFGYYSVAAMVASGLATLVNPVFTAIFPSFSTLVAQHNDDALVERYHRSALTMAALIFPPMVMIAWFSHDVLHAWTGDPATAIAAGPVLSLLILGSGLNGIMNVPWALQLAHGYLRLGIIFNLVSIVVLLPMVLIGANLFGTTGAAAGWLVLNSSYVFLGIPLIHRKFLPGHQWRWYLRDNLVPLTTVITVTIATDLFIRWSGMPVIIAIVAGIIGCYALGWRSLTALLAKSS